MRDGGFSGEADLEWHRACAGRRARGGIKVIRGFGQRLCSLILSFGGLLFGLA